LAPYNPVIVSGLANGVDIAAHKAALQYGLNTIAILPMVWIKFTQVLMQQLPKLLLQTAVCLLII